MKRLEKILRTQDKSKVDKKTELSGRLGVHLGDADVVEVPNRSGFHYVYLNEQKELIQAFNDKTSPIMNLPVIVVWNVNRYEVQEIDKRRYGTWNSNYLPKHGNQHSFNPDGGGGGDVTFIYGKQFVPLSLTPSGTFGAPVAIIAPYSQLHGSWNYIPATTTPNIVSHKPTDNQARMVLVCMDWDTRAAQIIVGSTLFSASLTGSADVIPYLPIPTGINQVPIGGVRLVSGTTVVSWQNIYDVRQFFHPIATGSSGGGGGGGGGSIDTIGLAGLDEGIFIATGTAMNVVGSRASLSASGTMLQLTISPDPAELIGIYGLFNGAPLGTGTMLDVGNNLTLSLSGTTLRLDANAQAGGGGVGNTYPAIYDDGAFIATGTKISFNTNLEVSSTGTSVFVNAPITTYFRVGQPTQLSGNFWRVPDRVYASGSLGIFDNGVALTPGVDYAEQIYVSGTYQYLSSSFSGTPLAFYGVPCSPQTHISTGTPAGSPFDLMDSNSVLLLDSNGIQLLDSNG